MAVFPLSAMPGVSLYITYTAATGRATSLNCDNDTGQPIQGFCTIPPGSTGEGTYGQAFPPGRTFLNFPNNVVSIVTNTDPDGETRLELRPLGIRIEFGYL